MYLFDKKGKTIEVFTLNPNNEKIEEFKRREMDRIPDNKRVLYATTNNDRVLETKRDYIPRCLSYAHNYLSDSQSRLNHINLFHKLLPSTDEEENSKTLEEYYTSKLTSNSNPLTIWNPFDKDIQFLLLTNPKYTKRKYRYIFDMKGIINITSNLYNLEKLTNEGINYFDKISEKELAQIISLYNFKKDPISEINLEEINKMENFEIPTSPLFNEINSRIKSSSKALKLIKK